MPPTKEEIKQRVEQTLSLISQGKISEFDGGEKYLHHLNVHPMEIIMAAYRYGLKVGRASVSTSYEEE